MRRKERTRFELYRGSRTFDQHLNAWSTDIRIRNAQPFDSNANRKTVTAKFITSSDIEGI
jgi:hypothetical protein